MFVKVLAVVLAASHVATIGAIVLWFGLGKPRSMAEFWQRFGREFLPSLGRSKKAKDLRRAA